MSQQGPGPSDEEMASEPAGTGEHNNPPRLNSAKPKKRQEFPNLALFFTQLLSNLFGINFANGIDETVYAALKVCAWLIRRNRPRDSPKDAVRMDDKVYTSKDGKTTITTTKLHEMITTLYGKEGKGDGGVSWYPIRETLAEVLVHSRNMKSFAGLTDQEKKSKHPQCMPNILPMWVGDKVHGAIPPPKTKQGGKSPRVKMIGHRRINPIGKAFGHNASNSLLIPKGSRHFQAAYVYACFGNVVAPLGAVKFEIMEVDVAFKGITGQTTQAQASVAKLNEVPVMSKKSEPGFTIDMWGIARTKKSTAQGKHTYYVRTYDGNIVAKRQHIDEKGTSGDYDSFSIYEQLQELFGQMLANGQPSDESPPELEA